MAHYRCRCGVSEAFGPAPVEGKPPIHHTLCASCGSALNVVEAPPEYTGLEQHDPTKPRAA